MTRNFLLFASLFALTAIFPAYTARGQQAAGPYTDVKAWTISYWVLVTTPDGCCKIESEETTEGKPDTTVTYSIYRSFKGSFVVHGPIEGFRNPDKIGGADAPATGMNAQIIARSIGKYLGWMVEERGFFSSDPKVQINIKDDYSYDSKSKDCANYTLKIDRTARFDDSIASKYPHADLGFDLVKRDYTVDLSIGPVNPGDDMRVVDVHVSTHSTSTDPSDPPSEAKNADRKDRLADYMHFHSASVQLPDLKFRGPLPDGAQSLSVCRVDKDPDITFSAVDEEVNADIKKNKTVKVSFLLNIRKGEQKFSIDESCK